MILSQGEMFIRLTLSFVLGGLIGLEREIQGKKAGFRTNALVCLGSALMMVCSIAIHEAYKGEGPADPGRIAAQVITGIGFLGAGAIMRAPEGIRGLTTAAGIWVTAGIGLACGMGLYLPALFTTCLSLIILLVFLRVDQWVEKHSHHSNKPKSEV